MTQPATTAPDVNTDLVRTLVAEHLNCEAPENFDAVVIELCDAVDTLRKHFAGQQIYINSLERRLNNAPHGNYCTKTKNTPCDCWKAS